jgi:hypothetical protein
MFQRKLFHETIARHYTDLVHTVVADGLRLV